MSEPDFCALVREAEALCQQIAGEDLASKPVYVLCKGELPPDQGGSAVCGGWTCQHLDLLLRDVIGQRWRGRGACLVVNEDFVASEGGDFRRVFLSVVLHELAHALLLEEPSSLPSAKALQDQALEMGHCVANLANYTEGAGQGWNFYEHRADRFVRVALHLAHRSCAAGLIPILDIVCAGPPPSRMGMVYGWALADELKRLAYASIAQVLQEPLPPAFAELWQEDLGDFLAQPDYQIFRHFFGSEQEERRAPMKLLDVLVAKLTKRTKARCDTFLSLVRQIADGREPEITQVEAILVESGKTANDLQKMVTWCLHRRELAAKIARAEGTVEERARVTAKIESLDADLRKAEGRHREATAPLVARLRELATFDSDALGAKIELHQSIDSDLRARFVDLERREREATRKRDELAEVVNRNRIGASTMRDKAEYDHHSDRKSCLAAAEQYETARQHYQGQLQPVEQQLQDLAAEREQLDRLALVP